MKTIEAQTNPEIHNTQTESTPNWDYLSVNHGKCECTIAFVTLWLPAENQQILLSMTVKRVAIQQCTEVETPSSELIIVMPWGPCKTQDLQPGKSACGHNCLAKKKKATVKGFWMCNNQKFKIKHVRNLKCFWQYSPTLYFWYKNKNGVSFAIGKQKKFKK